MSVAATLANVAEKTEEAIRKAQSDGGKKAGRGRPSEEKGASSDKGPKYGTDPAYLAGRIKAAAKNDQAMSAAAVEALATRAEAAPTKADAAKKGGKAGGRGRAKAEDAKPPDSNKAAYGTGAEYLAARIARDAPAVHEDMKAGKYPSVRRRRPEAQAVERLRPASFGEDPAADREGFPRGEEHSEKGIEAQGPDR